MTRSSIRKATPLNDRRLRLGYPRARPLQSLENRCKSPSWFLIVLSEKPSNVSLHPPPLHLHLLLSPCPQKPRFLVCGSINFFVALSSALVADGQSPQNPQQLRYQNTMSWPPRLLPGSRTVGSWPSWRMEVAGFHSSIPLHPNLSPFFVWACRWSAAIGGTPFRMERLPSRSALAPIHHRRSSLIVTLFPLAPSFMPRIALLVLTEMSTLESSVILAGFSSPAALMGKSSVLLSL